MNAQQELKNRAKDFIVSEMSKHSDPVRKLWFGISWVTEILTKEGFKISDRTVRRYITELLNDKLLTQNLEAKKMEVGLPESQEPVKIEEPEFTEESQKDPELAKEVKVAQTVEKCTEADKSVRDGYLDGIMEKVAEIEEEEEEAAEDLPEKPEVVVEDEDLISSIKMAARKIMDSGRLAEIEVSFSTEEPDVPVKMFASSIEKLDAILKKLDQVKDTIYKVEVTEIKSSSVPPKKKEEKAQEKDPKSTPKKSRRTKGAGASQKKDPAPASTTAAPRKKSNRTIPPKRKNKYTRANALAEYFSTHGGGTKEEIIAGSNQLYVQNGGKDNLKESKWFFNNSLSLLELMNVVKVDGETVATV